MMTPVKADQLMNSLRPYRLPFLKRIAASGRISLTVWHGQPADDRGAPHVAAESLPIPDRHLRNVHLPWGRHRRVIWQRGALSILRSESRVVICAEVVHNPVVWLLALIHRIVGKGLVLDGHFVRSGPNPGYRLVSGIVRKFLHRFADAYVAYTEGGREALITEGVDPEKVFVSMNTLDTELLSALAERVDDEACDALRKELGVAEGHVLLYVGKLAPVKRVDLAIEILRYLDGNATLVVIGDGTQRKSLEEASEGLPVQFRGAIYNEEELARYFMIADLLVLPGRVGLTCVHGFANGVPCLTTSDEIAEQSPEYEYVEDGYNGVILLTDDPAHQARAIRVLLNDPETLSRLKTGARKTARRLTMDRMVKGFEDAVLKAARADS